MLDLLLDIYRRGLGALLSDGVKAAAARSEKVRKNMPFTLRAWSCRVMTPAEQGPWFELRHILYRGRS